MVNYNGRETEPKTFTRTKKQGSNRRPGGSHSFAGYGTVGEVIEGVLANGGFISFNRTSDGGASRILVLSGDDELKGYYSSNAELLEAFEVLRKEFPIPGGKLTVVKG